MKTEIHTTNRAHFKINLKIFWILSIFLIAALLGIWIFQINLLAKNSRLVSLAQYRLTELSQKDVLEDLETFKQGVSEIEKLAQSLNFEKIDKVLYIQAVESTVLAR